MLQYDRKKTGKLLKNAREKAGLTQGEVARRLGYTSPQFISNIERGTSVTPLKTLSRMLAIYKVNPDPVIKVILESQAVLLRKMLGGRRDKG